MCRPLNKHVKSDALLESACKSAELKLVRFQAKSGYQVQAVREQINLAINPLGSAESLNNSTKSDALKRAAS